MMDRVDYVAIGFMLAVASLGVFMGPLGWFMWIPIWTGAACVLALALENLKRDLVLPPQPQKPPAVDFRAAMANQAKEAEERKGRSADSDESLWLSFAVIRLMELWPSMSEAEARRELLEFMRLCGMKFPDPDYVWTAATAREFAEIYVQETGESLSNH